MPCCCATNVKAAFVLGIILAFFSVLSCFNEMQGAIANGIIGAVIHCILIFGAHTRNSMAILVWMIFAILSCIGLAIMAVLSLIVIAHAGVAGAGGGAPGGLVGADIADIAGATAGVAAVFLVFLIGVILFQIWTIVIAKNARREIEAGQ